MTDLTKLREIADRLYNEGRFEDSYHIYSDVIDTVWSSIGTAQTGINEYSRSYLSHNISKSVEFRNQQLEATVSSIFIKWFDVGIEAIYNEFTESLNGFLQSIIYSHKLIDELSYIVVVNNFFLLHNLVLRKADNDWLSSVLKVFTPIIEDNRIKRIRLNLTEERLFQFLTENARTLQNTGWEKLNNLLLEYLVKTDKRDNKLYEELRKLVGFQEDKESKKRRYKQQYQSSTNNGFKYGSSFGSGEKQTHSESRFDAKKATEIEKAKYYGKILGLTGLVTKTQIRQSYLKLISQYHPDKVEKLGKEFIDLAEVRTKELNEAYQWMKSKYKL